MRDEPKLDKVLEEELANLEAEIQTFKGALQIARRLLKARGLLPKFRRELEKAGLYRPKEQRKKAE